MPSGVGIGLHFAHHAAVLADPAAVAWVEIHPENYIGDRRRLRELARIRRDIPMSFDGVGLSLGSAGGICDRHLGDLAELVDQFEPVLISEHAAWCRSGNRFHADLLPLPLTEEALDIMCRNVERTQERLRRTILVENPSTYLEFIASKMSEPEFLTSLARRTGCKLLCDVNNIVVSCANHRLDPLAYLQALPAGAIAEIHIGGHAIESFGDGRSLRIDDHGSAPPDDVWALYDAAIARFGRLPTLLEWDNAVPALDVLLAVAASATNRAPAHVV